MPWQAPVALSFVVLALLLLLNDSRSGDLSRWYTDHLHHSYATWVALHRGLDIYTQPFGESLQGVDYPHAEKTWEHMPGMVYPPGVFAVFLPLAALGRWVPMGERAWAATSVLYMLLLAHLAWAGTLRALRVTAAAGVVPLAVLSWLILARIGLQGFFDGAYLGAGALVVVALARGQHRAALWWFCLAALLHFRAVILVPLAAAALWGALRGRPVRDWPWRELALLAVVGVLVVGSFVLTLPVTSGFREAQRTLLSSGGTKLWLVLGLSAVAVALSLWLADAVVAGTVAVGCVLAIIYVNFWWHGAVLLFAPLAVGAFRPGRSPRVARLLLIGWVVCMQPLAWRDPVSQVLVELQHFRLRS